jgi:hypothetical protein
MTPAERQLVADLFDRLATLEDASRDPEAERAIRDGLSQAPNAVYALVQTALVQDEALKRANSRIQELEAELGGGSEPPRQGGFLDSMRDSIFGRRDEPRGSVPQIRSGGAPMGAPDGYRAGAQPMGTPAGYGGPQGYPESQPRAFGGGGGSFLGTAAAAAAGVIGGSLLLDSIRGVMGGRSGGLTNPAAAAETGGSPWGVGGGGGGSDDLARQLGRDDIGRGQGGDAYGQSGQGLLSDASDRYSSNDSFDDKSIDDGDFDVDDGGDFGGDIGGGD